MSRIKGSDTAQEVAVRSFLFRKGLRFRKNVKTLPGKPDIVLQKFKTVIFINGCFWHRHGGCKLASTPKTRTDFWLKKFDRNVKNDIVNNEKLTAAGWTVITIWECELKTNFASVMESLVSKLRAAEQTEK